MDVSNLETIELYLSGSGIKPGTLRASEVADLITAYEDALISMIVRDSPEANIDEVFLSLVDIQEGSARFKFLPNMKPLFFGAALSVNSAIISNNLSTLPYKTVESLSKIWGFTKRKNCQAEIIGSEIPKATITPEVVIRINKDFFYEGETTLFGRVERVGGSEPKVKIRLDNNQMLYIEVNETDAKKLATRLYESISLNGFAKWRKDNFLIEDFKIDEIIGFEEKNIEASIQELRQEIGKYWDKIEDADDYFMKNRYETDQS